MFLFVCVLAFFACVSLRTRVCVCVGMSFIRCLGNGTESARHETSEQARAMDVKTQQARGPGMIWSCFQKLKQAWLGVKNHHIVSLWAEHCKKQVATCQSEASREASKESSARLRARNEGKDFAKKREDVKNIVRRTAASPLVN